MSENKLVPLEPTEEMIETGYDTANASIYPNRMVVYDTYKAMLAAAPSQASNDEAEAVTAPCVRLHITETDEWPDIKVEVLDGTNLQPSMSPVELFTTPPKIQTAVALALKNAAALITRKNGYIAPKLREMSETIDTVSELNAEIILASIPPDAEAALKAYVDEQVREALEKASLVPREHAIVLQDGIFGTRFPDEALAVLRATDAMATKIRALIPAKEG